MYLILLCYFGYTSGYCNPDAVFSTAEYHDGSVLRIMASPIIFAEDHLKGKICAGMFVEDPSQKYIRVHLTSLKNIARFSVSCE